MDVFVGIFAMVFPTPALQGDDQKTYCSVFISTKFII